MYQKLSYAIQNEKYSLDDMLNRIDSFEARLKLTIEEAEALRKLAIANVDPNTELPAAMDRITALERMVAELTERVTVLENGGITPEPEPGVPEWKQPTGAHDAYRIGDVVMYEGQKYICNVDYNVYAPNVTGWKVAE